MRGRGGRRRGRGVRSWTARVMRWWYHQNKDMDVPARTNDLMSVQLGVRFSRKARQPLISPSGLKSAELQPLTSSVRCPEGDRGIAG